MEIASVDYLTTPGILELNLVEAQDNRDLDNTSLGIARIINLHLLMYLIKTSTSN